MYRDTVHRGALPLALKQRGSVSSEYLFGQVSMLSDIPQEYLLSVERLGLLFL